MENKNWKPADEREVRNYFMELRRFAFMRREYLLVYVTYLLYLRNIYDKENALNLSQLLEKRFSDHRSNLEYVLRDRVSVDVWDIVRNNIGFISDNVLETVLLDTTGEYFTSFGKEHSGYMRTPDTLLDLVNHLLEIKPGEEVFDICCGTGNFTVKSFLEQPEASYYSKDINPDAVSLSEIRKDVLERNYADAHICVEAGNVLEEREKDSNRKYDKVFGHYPWMIDLVGRVNGGASFFGFIEKGIPGILTRNASDWAFNFLMIHHLKESGKAVGIMTNGSTWNQVSGCRGARKYFLEHGLIEAVIALPNRLFKEIGISAALIVFSHGNDTVKMIDASQLCIEKNRQIVLSAENIETILKAYKEDGDYSISVSVGEILKGRDIVIHPSRYLTKCAPIKDGQRLGSVLKEVHRGASIVAKELDELITDKPSEYQYVMLKNINDGMIDENLPYISGLDQRYERFIAPNRSLLLSKIGTPFKCAVVEAPDRKILVNGNLFILQVDETKANPYYLKALFESSYGTSLLSQICIGSIFPTFNKRALEDMVIPLPPLSEQDKIAKRYLVLQDEIRICNMKLANAAEEKLHLFDDMQEG